MGVMEIEKTTHGGVLILMTRRSDAYRDFFSESWNRKAVVNVDTLTYAARLDDKPWGRALLDRNGLGKRLSAG
ncbi:MAG: hypothetical protein AB8B85_18970 [Paracoccaceae bacterium]